MAPEPTSTRRIVDYEIASGRTRGELAERVSILLKGGWQPFGTPGLTSTCELYQTMVRYEEPCLPTGLCHASVQALMKGEGVSQAIQDSVVDQVLKEEGR